MAGSVNKVILVGNLGQDPEVRTFQNGGKVCNLNIATSESWKDRNTGERQERTEWHRVAIFSEGLIGVVEQYLRKGSQVYIEGQLKTRKWQDQDTGQDRYTTEVVMQQFNSSLVMLGSRNKDDDGGEGYHGSQAGSGQADGGHDSGQAGSSQTDGGYGDGQTGGGYADDGGYGDSQGGQSGTGLASEGIDDDEIPF